MPQARYSPSAPVLSVTAEQARRVLLDAQQLGADPTRRAGPAAVDRLINQLGFVQLDSICVLERAHHLTLRSRLGGYRPSHLRTLLEQRRTLFEHWTHDASAIPTAWYHHWKHRFARYAESDRADSFRSSHMGDDFDRTIGHVLKRIRREGPLRSRDFQPDGHRRGTWWTWKPAKAALDYLWRCGRLAVTRREGFEKVYDLAVRVHGDPPRRSTPRAHLDWACGAALERLGMATPVELAAFFRAVNLADARTWVDRALESGTVVPVEISPINPGKPIRAVAPPDIETRIETAMHAPALARDSVRLLCPFDPVIRDRHRLERLFGFAYRFEAFVPEKKRRYGYYVLPILQGDRLVGRADLKTDRPGDRLQVRGLWWETGVKPTATRRRALLSELESLGAFVGVGTVEYGRSTAC